MLCSFIVLSLIWRFTLDCFISVRGIRSCYNVILYILVLDLGFLSEGYFILSLGFCVLFKVIFLVFTMYC